MLVWSCVDNARKPALASPGESRGGGEILTFPDTLTTQGLSLWCFNTVGGEILTFPDTLTTQGLTLSEYMVFQHSDTRAYKHDLNIYFSVTCSRHFRSLYQGSLPRRKPRSHSPLPRRR